MDDALTFDFDSELWVLEKPNGSLDLFLLI